MKSHPKVAMGRYSSLSEGRILSELSTGSSCELVASLSAQFWSSMYIECPQQQELNLSQGPVLIMATEVPVDTRLFVPT